MENIILPAGKKKFIHVNRHRIDANRKHGESEPTITVKQGKNNFYGRDVLVEGKVRLTQEECQLSCGARVYIITFGKVTVSS
jgi:hypothetical protein